MAPHPPQLVLKQSYADGDKLFKAQPVSSPTVGHILESQLVVGMPDAPHFAKVRTLQDKKFAIDGIQGSLDEDVEGLKSNGKAVSGVPKKAFVDETTEERAAVEHDDDFEDDAACGKIKTMEDDVSLKEWSGVKHSVLLTDIPERHPVQVTDSSDSDTDEEDGPPSVRVPESSEEICMQNADVESPVQPLAKAAKKLSQNRHVSGKRKRKRNVYTVVIDPPPLKSKPRVNQPRRKKARWASKPKHSIKQEDIDALIAEFCARDTESMSMIPNKTANMRDSHRGHTNTPRDSVDSGLESGNFEGNHSSSSGGNGESNSGGDSMSGGGSSGGGGGQGGGGGDDNGENHEKDQELIMIIDDDTNDEEEDPSSEEMDEELDKQVPGHKVIDFDISDLQHACYCRPGKPCMNDSCKKVKQVLAHVEAHHEFSTCTCCSKAYGVIKTHAGHCHLPGCRVPYCADIREGKIAPAPVTPPGTAQPVNVWYPTPVSEVYETRTRPYFVDGQVIYKSQNADFIVGTHFQEHIDYHVQRSDKDGKLGQGSTGQVFKIITIPRLPLVVKEAMKGISREELEIYRALGNHENIAEHYAVTYHGTEGKAHIFMQEYATSVYDYMAGRYLDIETAMYIWCQVLDGVENLHHRPVPIVHKDVKAKNVLLCHEDARAKLADFDSAKFLPDEVTRSGLPPKGTPGFAAPEVRNCQPHGTPADIHSMGCFLLEMTVGIPYSATEKAQKLGELAQLDPDLAHLVCACMDPLPYNRPTAVQIKQWPVVKKYNQTAAA